MRRVVLAALAALPLAGSARPAAPTGDVYAERITAENFARALRGPGADAGIGDWMFTNGTLCASVSAPEHETYLSARGGSLVDLGYCGRDDDQWSAYHDLMNLSRDDVVGASEVGAEVSGEAATIRVRGAWGGIEVETRYTLARAAAEELAIETTVRRVADSDALSLFGSLVLHTHRGLTPFVVSTTAPQWSKGFRHPFVDTNDRTGMTKLLFPADLSVLIGPASGAPEISYGLLSATPEHVDEAGERTHLRQFAIDDQDFSLVGAFSEPLWFDSDAQPGLLQLAQVPLMDLAVGESLHIRRRVLVSARADAASITDRVYAGGTVRGHAGSAENRLLVTDAEGHPLSFAKPAEDASFELRLPAGVASARLVLNTPFREGAESLPAQADGPAVRFASTAAPAQLELPDHGMPMRLVFKGRGDTADPLFGSDLRGFQVGERVIPADVTSNGVSLAGVAGDPESIALPAGEYRVYATRGPEYTLEKTDISLTAGERARLTIAAPRRALATRQWLAADFHVHGEFSFDSTLPARARIADFVAQGGEVLVVSEHKRLVDYQPIVTAMGLAESVVTLTGTELTGVAHGERIARTIGHANVFPLQAEPLQFQGGVLPHENRRLGEVIAAHKQRDPRVVFQLNHPRKAGDTVDEGQFFNHLAVGRAYDPAQSLQSEANRSLLETLPGIPYRDIDFDALEVLNGKDFESYPLLRADWFSFLRQGQRKLATGNSDSHSTRAVVAMPRNYVRIKDARADAEGVARFDREGFLDAVHAGKLFASTGPLLDVRLDGKGLGRTVRGREATLTIRIHAADWVPVERLRVFVNGELLREAPASRHGTHELSLTFARDSFVTVEVEGTPGGAYRAVYPGLTPFAFTNPIWVDADGDGQWTAPGLAAK